MWEKFAWICMGVVLMGAVLFAGCHNSSDKVTSSPRPEITETGHIVQDANATLKSSTAAIITNTNQIEANTPAALKPQITPHTTAILQSTAVQADVSKKLDEVNGLLASANKKSSDLESALQVEKDKVTAANNSETAALQKTYRTASILCFVGVLVCGGLVAYGQKWAMTVGVLCGVGCAVCIFIVQTVSLVPWIVGGCIAVAVAVGIYYVYKNKGQITVLNTATKELTSTVEAIKPKLSMVARKDLFGDGPMPGKLTRTIQSDSTMEIIAAHRAKLPNLAPSIPATVAADYNGDGVIDERDIAFVKTFRAAALEAVTAPSAPTATAHDPLAPSPRPKGFGGKHKIGGPTTRAKIVLH